MKIVILQKEKKQKQSMKEYLSPFLSKFKMSSNESSYRSALFEIHFH
jgi:hypothetical protein